MHPYGSIYREITMEKNLNEIAKYEKAIKDKYGSEAIQNPKRSWDEEKEKSYLEDLKKFYDKKEKQKNKKSVEGFEIIEKKTNVPVERSCPVCGAFSMSTRDDLYMSKFQCCFNCYIQYVDGREERWKTGWRPNK